MSEKSPNFKIEIPSSVVPEPVRKGRKAHRSSLGALYAALQIFGQLASLVICGLAFYYFIENDDSEHTALTKLRMIIGIPYNAYLSQTDEEQYFIIAALSCFALSSFLQLTVFWRAYFSPRFLAKNPSLSKFWPMAVSFVLRVASEALYKCTSTKRDVSISILWICLSLAYCVLVVDIYWYDDDNPPKMALGDNGYILKAWYVEPIELPQ